MRLAWFNIAHDRVRFVVTVAGIMCAVFLMIFQGSMLLGFLHAASKVIDSTDADIWIAGRGVPCFEFPVPIESRLAEITRGTPGVAGSSQIAAGPIQIRLADGTSQQTILIGAEPGAGEKLPTPRLNDGSGPVAPEALLIDQSNAGMLQVSRLPAEVEANYLHARIIGETSGFSSFLGSPYVFSSYDDAGKYLHLSSNETMFLLLRLRPGVNVADVVNQLRARFPNVDVWTRAQFSRRARWDWISKTGAGGAILMAAMLGFCIGLAVVSQAVYATTMENIEEFAALKALGGSRDFVALVVVAQAVICGTAGYILGTLITLPLVKLATFSIPWITTPLWLPL